MVISWLVEGIRKLKSVCHQYSLGTRCGGDNLCKSLVLVQYSFGHGVRGWRAQLFSSLDSLLYVLLSLCLLVLLLVIYSVSVPESFLLVYPTSTQFSCSGAVVFESLVL